MTEPIISLRGVSRTYDMGRVTVPALRDVDLDVARGEFVAIVGPSGSGKTTMMNILGCLDRPTAGTYLLAGDARRGARRRRPGPRPQPDDRLRLPVLQPAAADERARQRGHAAPVPGRRAAPSAERRAKAALERLGLGDRIDHEPTELSGGQQQRVAIARALVTDPALILADEPTGNLDRPSGAEVMELFRELHAAGRTIVLITHDADVAAGRRAARSTSATGGWSHEPHRARPARALAPPHEPPPGRPDDARRDHRRRVGRRAGRRRPGDDVEHHRPPVEPRHEPAHDQPGRRERRCLVDADPRGRRRAAAIDGIAGVAPESSTQADGRRRTGRRRRPDRRHDRGLRRRPRLRRLAGHVPDRHRGGTATCASPSSAPRPPTTSASTRRRSGREISIGGLPFRLIGILQPKGGSGFQDPDDQVLVPIGIVPKYFVGGDSVRTIGVSVADEAADGRGAGGDHRRPARRATSSPPTDEDDFSDLRPGPAARDRLVDQRHPDPAARRDRLDLARSSAASGS